MERYAVPGSPQWAWFWAQKRRRQRNAEPAVVLPELSTATVLSDGVTLRLVFTLPLTAGDEVGLTWSAGTITSASVVDGNLDCVIPKIYDTDDAGTIEYDGTGTLAGDTGAVAAFGPVAITNNGPAWTPAELPGIIDYGVWDDLSRLKQNSNGTGAVASPGDPVGYWMGQLDTLSLVQATIGNKPAFAATGVDFDGLGTAPRTLTRVVSYSASGSFTLAAGNSSVGAVTSYLSIGTVPSSSAWRVNQLSTGSVSGAHRGVFSTLSGVAIGTVRTAILTGSATAASVWINGAASVAITAGTGSDAITGLSLSSNSLGAGSRIFQAWVVCSGVTISDEDAANLHAWFVAQGSV